MTKLVTESRINVAGSIKALKKRQKVEFPADIRESTIRCSATRAKNETGMRFSVRRTETGSHIVTRIF